MRIRPTTDDEWPSVLELHRRAFAGDVEAAMADAVRGSDGWIGDLSLAAEDDGALVGHALTSRVGLGGSDRELLQLGPIGVLPEHRGRGIGSALVGATLDAVRARGEPLLLVEGDPAYYGRFGFVRADALGLLPPPEALHEWAFQVAVLGAPAGLPQGRVVYPPTFPH